MTRFPRQRGGCDGGRGKKITGDQPTSVQQRGGQKGDMERCLTRPLTRVLKSAERLQKGLGREVRPQSLGGGEAVGSGAR